jgi:two-component system sensor histidine kinase AlgZ
MLSVEGAKKSFDAAALASPATHADNRSIRHGRARPAPLFAWRAHTAIAVQPIIGQNPEPLAFPDLRNLGTLVRILLGANLLVAVGALARAPRWDAFPAEWLDAVSVAEPHIVVEVTLLVAIAPWLATLSWGAAAAVVLVLTAATGLLTDMLTTQVMMSAPASIARHLLFSLLVAGALLYYLRLRAKALSPAIIEARLQALQARIRPHFLFNSLNAVISLVRVAPRRAESALEDMADLFRVLMGDNRDLVPLADELELCRKYLDLEKLRLGDRLRLEWHTNSMPDDAMVPPLVLQPLLENAVYHGIEPLPGPGVISINIFASGGQVHAILRNPLVGEAGSHRQGNKMAIANVRERLALHYDVEASLESHVKGDHYEVHIRIPYRPFVPARSAADGAPLGERRGHDAASATGRPEHARE